MTPNQIIIVSPNGLFRAGLKRLLRNVPELTLVGEAVSLQEAEQIAKTTKFDVVIVDQVDDEPTRMKQVSRLLSIPMARLRVVALSLATGDMQVYRRDQVAQASVEGLIAALVKNEA